MYHDDSIPAYRECQNLLCSIARRQGFDTLPPVHFFDAGIRPEVLAWNARVKQLFMGDIKVSAIDRWDSETSLELPKAYLARFKDLLGDKTVSGGVIAITADSPEAVEGWSNSLFTHASRLDLTNQFGALINFEIAYRERIWLTWGATNPLFQLLRAS